ncbi:hypothetical protein tb265_04830 [Gemmatimonadetes bacterium T265]|nr:hypothetical protein tb265_04830 [Gemmatimonadetes bacterium T265]
MRWLRRALAARRPLAALCGAVLAVVGACAPDLPTTPATPGVLRKVVVPTPGFTQLSVDANYDCALKRDGSIACWGSTPTRSTPPSAIVGQPFTLALQGAHVPGGYASTFTYAFDCGTGTYATTSTTPSTSCTAPAAGPVTVRGKVIDQDQDATEYTATVTVLTPVQAARQLRAAVASSGIPADVRQGLTDRLDAALASLGAGQTGTACNQLGAFRNQLQAQRGKAVPAATADG